MMIDSADGHSESRAGMPSAAASVHPRECETGLRTSVTDSRAEELEAANRALQAEIQERRRAEEVARGQTEALAQTLYLLAAEPEIDKFVGQVLQALTQQFGARWGEFWLYDAAERAPLLHLAYDDPGGLQVSSAAPGAALFISEGTVKFHVNHLLGKLGVSDRTQAVIAALKRGLASLD